jgi:hypothetical protein
MGFKKITGIIFVMLATILTLAIIGQLPQLFKNIFGFFMMFTGRLNSQQAGEVTGHMIYWSLHITVTVILWMYGLRWARTPSKT